MNTASGAVYRGEAAPDSGDATTDEMDPYSTSNLDILRDYTAEHPEASDSSGWLRRVVLRGHGGDLPFPDVRSEMRFEPNPPSLLPPNTFLVGSKGTQTNYNGK